MNKVFYLITTVSYFFTVNSYAQSDTIYTYFDKNKKITSKNDAVYVSKTFLDSSKWHKQVFLNNTSVIYLDGFYEDQRTHTPNGIIKHYNESGNITDSNLLEHGQLKEQYNFYTNHQIKNYIIFLDSVQVKEQGGFTEQGEKIENYIFYKPAEYPDGKSSWEKYLINGVRKNRPKSYKKNEFEGEVIVEFTIDTTGIVTNIKTKKTSGFIDMDQSLIRVIEKSKKWSSAINENKKVNYVVSQKMNFLSNELYIRDLHRAGIISDAVHIFFFPY